MKAVAIEVTPRFRAGPPQSLFSNNYFNEVGTQWDVTPDGNRFLMLKRSTASGGVEQSRRIVLVHHWLEELKRLVPAQ